MDASSLIDHGAALYIHYTWRDPGEHARRPFDRIRDHLLLPFAESIEAADERLAPQLTPDLVQSIVDLVPDSWLEDDALSRRHAGGPAAQRAAYAEYLGRRLESPRPFVEGAEAARGLA